MDFHRNRPCAVDHIAYDPAGQCRIVDVGDMAAIAAANAFGRDEIKGRVVEVETSGAGGKLQEIGRAAI